MQQLSSVAVAALPGLVPEKVIDNNSNSLEVVVPVSLSHCSNENAKNGNNDNNQNAVIDVV